MARLLLLFCLLASSRAFSVVSSFILSHRASNSAALRADKTSQLNAVDHVGPSSRRLFSKNFFASSAAFLVSSSTIGGALVASAAEGGADIGDDLSMPDEPKPEVVSEEEVRTIYSVCCEEGGGA